MPNWDGALLNQTDLYNRPCNKWAGAHDIAHCVSPCGVPKEMGSLGSEGSLTPYLLMERTLKQYCLPLTRSNTGNLGEFTTMSRLASSQLFFPARDWSKHRIGKKHKHDFKSTINLKDMFITQYPSYMPEDSICARARDCQDCQMCFFP